jgi:hypothetical protein
MLLLQAEKEIRHFTQKLHVKVVNKPRSPRSGIISYHLAPSRPPIFLVFQLPLTMLNLANFKIKFFPNTKRALTKTSLIFMEYCLKGNLVTASILTGGRNAHHRTPREPGGPAVRRGRSGPSLQRPRLLSLHAGGLLAGGGRL